MRVQVFVNGSEVEVYSLEVTDEDRGLSKVTVPYDLSISRGDVFEVKVDGHTIQKGTVAAITKQRRRGVKVLTCRGKTAVLWDKIVLDSSHRKYVSQDAGAIAKDLIDHYFSGTLTSNNIDTSTGTTISYIDLYGKTVGDALQELADRAGADFYVDDDGDVHFFVKGSEDSGYTITENDIFDIEVTEQGEIVNRVVVRGRGGAYGEAGSGTPEKYFEDRRIWTDTEAQEVAQTLLSKYQSARTSGKIVTFGFYDLRAKQKITINSPLDGYENQSVTVRRVTWRFSPGDVKTEIVVGDREPTLEDVIRELHRKLYEKLEIGYEFNSGTSFPSNPADGDLFYRTDEDRLYRYSSSASAWIKVDKQGLSEMDGDLDDVPDGATYKRTTENEKIGGGRAYQAINEAYRLITGFEKNGYVLDSLAGNNKVPEADKVDGVDLPAPTSSVLTDHDKALHDALGIDADTVDGLHLPNTVESLLTNHDKSLHDALGIDADTVDSKHYSDISAEIDNDIAAHKSDANAHHEAFTSADHDARDHRGLQILQSGALADRPAAGQAGRIYYATDEERYYLDTGTEWLVIAAPKLARLIERDHSSLTNVGPNDHHEAFTSSDHDSHVHPASVITPNIPGLADDGKLVLTEVNTPGPTNTVLSDHDKSLHDSLGIDADSVDGKHYSDISSEIDNDIATHKADANAHHEAFTASDHDARDHRGLRILQSGTLGSRPSAGQAGRIYYATDEEKYYLDTGSSWIQIASPKLNKLLGQVLESQIADGAVSLSKIASGVTAQPSEELETVVETKYITDISDETPSNYTTSTTFVDRKSYSWSITALGQEYETTTIRVRLQIEIHAHKDVPPGETVTAYAKVLEDGAAKGTVEWTIDSGSDGDTECTSAVSPYREIEWTTNKSSATIKIQLRISDGTYYETRIWASAAGPIQIQHKHRYKKYGVIKP